MSATTLHVVVAVVLVVAYTVLTVLGHDGNPLLVLLGGQAVGGGIQVVSKPTGE